MRQTVKTLCLILWAAASGYAVATLTKPDPRDWSRTTTTAHETWTDPATGIVQSREQTSSTEARTIADPHQFDLFHEDK